MFHGRKKQEYKPLSEEERKTINAKLVKIDTINKTMLAKRANKEYDEASLLQTEKFSYLSPDFATLWNYRREILQHLFEKSAGDFETLEGKLKIVGKELEFLLKNIKRSPKSYTLWFHRQWVIEMGLDVEKSMIKAAIKAKLEEKAKQLKEAAEAAEAAKAEQ